MLGEALTFGQTLDYYASIHPEQVVISCAHIDRSIATLTRAQLRQQSNALAGLLIDQGVAVGDLVPIILPTSVDFLVATTAIYKAGGSPMPVSHRLPESECQRLLELAKPKVVFAQRDWGFPSVYMTTAASAETQGAAAEQAAAHRVASDPIKALCSGGSTGKPKLILTRGPFTVPLGENPIGLALRFEASDLKYSPGPLYHNGPFWFSLNMLLSGGGILLNERFDAHRCLELIEQQRPTVLNLVPTMMQRMLHDPLWHHVDWSSVRIVWHLAAPCPAWAKEGFIDALGGEKILELWAATESTGMTALDGNEWLTHRGSVGKSVATDILIVDEARRPLPPGEIGEIFTRFAGQAANYHYLGADPLETVQDGYASVGDLGWLDDEGYLYLADRRTDLIISGGANIYPAEVESVISQHPAVRDVAVIGLKDPDLGRRVHAIVELYDKSEAVSADDLRRLCETQLVRYKVPRNIEFVPALPRNEAGKITRSALRAARD